MVVILLLPCHDYDMTFMVQNVQRSDWKERVCIRRCTGILEHCVQILFLVYNNILQLEINAIDLYIALNFCQTSVILKGSPLTSESEVPPPTPKSEVLIAERCIQDDVGILHERY